MSPECCPGRGPEAGGEGGPEAGGEGGPEGERRTRGTEEDQSQGKGERECNVGVSQGWMTLYGGHQALAPFSFGPLSQSVACIGDQSQGS